MERAAPPRDAERAPALDRHATIVWPLVAVAIPLPVEVLAALDGVPDDLPSALADAESAGLVAWHADARVEATERAIRSVSLAGPERSRLRGAVGRAARAATALPIDLVATWMLDGCRVEPDPDVVVWLLERADDELRRGRLDRSAAVLALVVDALERGHAAPGTARVRAHVRLDYVLRWLGRDDEARAVAVGALAAARASGDAADLAVAALAWRPDAIATSDDPHGVALVDAALGSLDGSEVELRSRLLAARSDALLFSDLAAASAAAREALDLGRASGDAETFTEVAYAYRLAHWHPARQDEMFALGTEMVAASPQVTQHAEFGAVVRLQVFLERGDWPHFDTELTAMGRRLEQAPRPLELLWWQIFQVARAQTRGEWDVAEALIVSSLELAASPEYGAAFQLVMTQRLITSWHRGDDLAALLDAQLLPAGPMRDSWEAGLLGWTCTRRDPAEVLAELDRFLADGVAGLRQDLTFGPVVSALAIAAAEVASVPHADVLAAGIEPYADQWAGTGGAVVNGPFALHLGRLLALLGRTDDAMTRLEQALTSCRAGGCRPWEARTELALAELCHDDPAGRHHATRAAALAEQLGMIEVAQRATLALGIRTWPAGLTDREVEVLRVLATGATNRAIADTLFVSIKTVERHLLNAYRKAGLRNRAEAATFTLREL